MEIIFGRENAEILREKYIVLDLEEVTKDGNTFEVFCLLSAETIGISELPEIEQWIKLHDEFLAGYKNKDYVFCQECITQLKGKFNGELDSFYDEISNRINSI